MAKLAGVDHEQLVADLAWEFCEKARCGKKVRMEHYLQQCPNDETREAFKELVNTDLLLALARQAKRSKRRAQLV